MPDTFKSLLEIIDTPANSYFLNLSDILEIVKTNIEKSYKEAYGENVVVESLQVETQILSKLEGGQLQYFARPMASAAIRFPKWVLKTLPQPVVASVSFTEIALSDMIVHSIIKNEPKLKHKKINLAYDFTSKPNPQGGSVPMVVLNGLNIQVTAPATPK